MSCAIKALGNEQSVFWCEQRGKTATRRASTGRFAVSNDRTHGRARKKDHARQIIGVIMIPINRNDLYHEARRRDGETRKTENEERLNLIQFISIKHTRAPSYITGTRAHPQRCTSARCTFLRRRAEAGTRAGDESASNR